MSAVSREARIAQTQALHEIKTANDTLLLAKGKLLDESDEESTLFLLDRTQSAVSKARSAAEAYFDESEAGGHNE